MKNIGSCVNGHKRETPEDEGYGKTAERIPSPKIEAINFPHFNHSSIGNKLCKNAFL